MSTISSPSLVAYQAARETLLVQISDVLRQDDRFVAAWLTGSYQRGNADAVSDLDLNVVVADIHAAQLCLRLQMIQAGTTEQRLALVSQFGTPAIIHENHYNAPNDGSFTFVLYADSALMIDWILIPQGEAERPPTARLLFDKVGIATQVEESVLPSPDLLAEKNAFFWMMLAITAKYIARQDDVKVQGFLDLLHQLVAEIESLLNRQPWNYHRGSFMALQVTRDQQVMTCRSLMQRMVDLGTQMAAAGIELPAAPIDTINRLLNLR